MAGETDGYLIYRCSMCGHEYEPWYVPDVMIAHDCLTNNKQLSRGWGEFSHIVDADEPCPRCEVGRFKYVGVRNTSEYWGKVGKYGYNVPTPPPKWFVKAVDISVRVLTLGKVKRHFSRHLNNK